MPKPTGSSWRATRFAPTDATGRALALEMAALIGLGVALVLAHEAFRYPLRLPGHHGLEGMALIVLGRLLSDRPWAASLVATAAATTTLFFGGLREPMTPVVHLLPGLILDLGVRVRPCLRRAPVPLSLLAGLAWASRPLAKWLALQVAPLDFGSLRTGLAYPFTLHLLFGSAGGLIAALLWRWRPRPRTPS